MTKDKEITVKSKKNEILDAYNEIVTKITQDKTADPKIEKKRDDEQKIVKTASDNSLDKIIKDISDIKIEISRNLDTLGEKMSASYKKFSDLEQAINIETRYLEEVYQIKINADSLSALISAQKEKKLQFDSEIEDKNQTFEKEMEEKRLQWKKETETHELLKKERDEQHPEYKDKKVSIEFKVNPEELVYKIADEGNGFDYFSIMNKVKNAVEKDFLQHGRGIAMTAQIFDEIKYNNIGNQVMLIKKINPKAAI